MPKQSGDDKWPSYIPAPREDIFALGVISLNYGYMENMLRSLFTAVLSLTDAQASLMFPKMQNDTREKCVREALKLQKFPEPIDKAILHFMDGYMICAKNRNLLMHSHHGGIHLESHEHGLVLTRNTRGGGRMSYLATAEKLRLVADDMNRFSTYSTDIYLKLQNVASARRENVAFDYDRNPLPAEPTLPISLEHQFIPDAELLSRSKKRN